MVDSLQSNGARRERNFRAFASAILGLLAAASLPAAVALAEVANEPRRPFDVRKEEGDGGAAPLGHTGSKSRGARNVNSGARIPASYPAHVLRHGRLAK